MEDTRFAVNSTEIAADVLDGEAVLINLANGMYYSLVGSGSFIWSCLENGLEKNEIVNAIVAQYDVANSQASEETDALFEELLREKLIVVTNEAGNGIPPEITGARQLYETSRLKIYSDMQELLALDPPMPDLTDAPWKESSDARGEKA